MEVLESHGCTDADSVVRRQSIPGRGLRMQRCQGITRCRAVVLVPLQRWRTVEVLECTKRTSEPSSLGKLFCSKECSLPPRLGGRSLDSICRAWRDEEGLEASLMQIEEAGRCSLGVLSSSNLQKRGFAVRDPEEPTFGV
jgi:hypothetical protein